MIQQKKTYLETKHIINYLLESDDELDTLISCNPSGSDLVTRDFDLYEALVYIREPDINRVRKLLETVNVIAYKNVTGDDKPVVTHKRIEEIKSELGGDNNG